VLNSDRMPLPPPQTLELPDGAATHWPRVYSEPESRRLFACLLEEIAWREEEVLIFGQRRRVPRLVAWYGDPDAAYTYSGTRHEPRPWTPLLAGLRGEVQATTGHVFNAVLLNRYRDGRDGMGWHADDEPELGRDPVIASLSFGAARRFRMRHRRRRDLTLELELGDGSLLLMHGATQHHWVHALPKTARPVAERINLTFRRILRA